MNFFEAGHNSLNSITNKVQKNSPEAIKNGYFSSKINSRYVNEIEAANETFTALQRRYQNINFPNHLSMACDMQNTTNFRNEDIKRFTV